MDGAKNQLPNDLRARLITFWDSRADYFSEYTEKCLEYNGWVSERFNDLMAGAKNLRIADIGTGAGFLAISYAQMGHEVTATEISPNMLEHAKAKAEARKLNIRFLIDDAEDTKLEPNSFDFVIMRDVLNGLVDPLKALERILNLLRPGGYIVISDGNYFLYKHDAAYKRREDYFRLRDGKGEYGSMIDLSEEDYNTLEELAGDLYANFNRGPIWHIDYLLKKGMNNLRVRCDDPIDYHQYSEIGKEKVPFRYSVIAQKPHDGPLTEPAGRFDKTHLYSGPLESHEDLGRCFTSLSDSSRIKLLAHLLEGPKNVSDLAEFVELSVNKTSYHLNILKEVGLVRSKKDGRSVRYYIADEGAVEYLLHTVSTIVRRR